MAKPKPVSKRRFYRLWFDNFNSFVDQGIAKLTRSEIAAYLILLHNTKPNGTARVGLAEIGETWRDVGEFRDPRDPLP